MKVTAYRPSRLAAQGPSEWIRRQDPLMPIVTEKRAYRSWDGEPTDWAILVYRGPLVCMKRLMLPYTVARNQAEALNRANAGSEICAVAVLMEGLDLERIIAEEEFAASGQRGPFVMPSPAGDDREPDQVTNEMADGPGADCLRELCQWRERRHRSFVDVGRRIAQRLRSLVPADVPAAEWQAACDQLAEILQADDDADAWQWFRERFPADLIPADRRGQFLEGLAVGLSAIIDRDLAEVA